MRPRLSTLAIGLVTTGLFLSPLVQAKPGIAQKLKEQKSQSGSTTRVQDNDRDDKRGREAWIGVTIETVDSDLVQRRGLEVGAGVYVSGVADDSPAEQAGIERGDVIVSYSGAPVDDASEFIDLVRESEPGQKTEVLVNRGGESMAFSFELGERERNTRPLIARFRDRDDNDEDRDIEVEVEVGDGDDDNDNDRDVNRNVIIRRMNPLFRGAGHSDSYIGVQLQDIGRDFAKNLGVTNGRGALVVEISDDSPAEKAGLKAGDIIVSVAGHLTVDEEEVRDEISDTDPGDTLKVEVVRGGRPVTIEVVVGERESADWGPSFGSGPDGAWFFQDHDKMRAPRAPGAPGAIQAPIPPRMRGLRQGKMDRLDMGMDLRDSERRLRELEKELKAMEERLRKLEK